MNKIESCQRWFTKRISGLSDMGYPERLAHHGLESLQVRRLKCDLLLCYKIIHCKVVIHDLDFLVFSDCCEISGHKYKRHSNVNALHTSISFLYQSYL